MTVDRKNILLWSPNQVGKYSPLFHSEDYTVTDKYYLAKNYNQPDFDWSKYPLRFSWKIKSEYEEKKLRTHDCFYEARGFLRQGGNGFFIHDWLLECWSDLIDKDIKVIPSTCSTLNGIVREFHLIYIINKVDGLDEILSIKLKNEYGICYKLVPKDNNDFMENHQIAIEQNFKSHIYVTPDLLSKILLKKKKLKDVWIMTFKERWDILYSKMYGPY